jgi:single-strand DNA-binding protein
MTRDPLMRHTPKGTCVTTFPVASSRYYRNDADLEKEVSFFDVECWGKLGESCGNLGHKGRGIRVVGRLRQDRWNGADGKPHSRVVIVAEHVEFRPEFKKVDESIDGYEDTTEIPPEDEEVEEYAAVTA